ncbi:MFS transporter [Amycolatopsis sp. NPDC059657]|uniref:MFS transporter n=1 Tax=Amycolatopsis sp. NPDC059657 TaxID=3346899 RepID=UPI0036705125
MTGLLRQPSFARLWTAAFFSESAEWMLQVALPIYLYRLTGSAASTAASIALGLVPALLLSPVAGVLADRADRRRLLCFVCAGQAAVAVPLLLADGQAVVYLVVAGQAALASLFEPARSALVPDLVGAERVTAANGLMSVNGNVARLVGGWLGGLVLGTAGLGWVVAAYSATLVVAFALLLKPFHAVPVAVPEREPVIRAWMAGLAAIRDSRRLRVASAWVVLSSLAQGMFLVGFVLFVLTVLGRGEAETGLLRGVQAVGGLAAGIVVATAAKRVAPEKLLGWGSLALSVVTLLIWNGPQLTTALGVYIGLFMAVGGPGVFAGTGLLTVIQTATPPSQVGRVLSTAFAAMAGCTALGSLAAGALVDILGLPVLLNAQALLHLAGAVVVLTGLVRTAVLQPA